MRALDHSCTSLAGRSAASFGQDREQVAAWAIEH
jgi:hypothetical protein